MSSLRDIMETSDVTIKQIRDHYKKNVINEVTAVKSRNRRTPLSAISKELDVSESTICSYMKDMNCTNKRKPLTKEQKSKSQLKMQLGKTKAMYQRDKINEDEYNKKVSDLNSKFEIEPSTEATTRSRRELINRDKRGGGELVHGYDVNKLMGNAVNGLTK